MAKNLYAMSNLHMYQNFLQCHDFEGYYNPNVIFTFSMGCPLPLPGQQSTVNAERSHSMIDIWNILEFKLVEKHVYWSIDCNQRQPNQVLSLGKNLDSDNNKSADSPVHLRIEQKK